MKAMIPIYTILMILVITATAIYFINIALTNENINDSFCKSHGYEGGSGYYQIFNSSHNSYSCFFTIWTPEYGVTRNQIFALGEKP